MWLWVRPLTACSSGADAAVNPAGPLPGAQRANMVTRLCFACAGTGTVINKTGIKQYQQATRDRSKVRSSQAVDALVPSPLQHEDGGGGAGKQTLQRRLD